MNKTEKRNKYFFGLGTVGRDMFYAFEANALLYFLSGRTAEFPKGAAACVEFSGPFRPGAGKLVYFLSPDDPRPNPK